MLLAVPVPAAAEVPSASGSLSTRVTTLENASASFAQDSGSNSIRLTNLESTASILTTASASFAVVSASYASASGSLSTRVTNLESTASVLTTASASFAIVSASYASASGSLSTRVTTLENASASFAQQSGSNSIRLTNLETTASVLTVASASFSLVSASYAELSGSFRTGSYTGSFTGFGSLTGSLYGTASWAVSASHAPTALTSSHAITASLALTASTADNFYVRQDITASNALIYGTLVAQTIHAQFITASTEFITGSTKFGTQLTDTHQFTGSVTITGSLSVNNSPVITDSTFTPFSSSVSTRLVTLENASASFAIVSQSFASTSESIANRVTIIEGNYATTGSNIFIGNQIITGSVKVTGGITGSLLGTASFADNATSSSYALTASFALNVPATASYALQALSSSFASTASFALNVPATASYALQALSSSFATTASYALNVPDTASYAIQALSSSHALTASYALNAGAGISSISIADEGVLIGTASYFDFIGANVSASVSNNTASITIIGGGGAAQTFTQTTPSTLWTVNHNFNSQTPLVQVYNISHSQIIPSAISASSTNTIDIYFATQETGYAVISTGGITVTGSNATLVQSVAATTWSFYHNLNETYPVFTIFDENDDVIIPLRIHADNAYSASIYFSSPRSGKAVAANCGLSGSTFESASFATTASFAFNALTSSYIIQAVSASYALSSSYAVSASNAISSSYAITSSYSLTASYAENIVISGSISNLDYIDFDTSVSYTLAEGRLGWDSGEGTLQLGLEGGNVTYALGEQIYQYVYNAEATTMTKGQVVYVSGSQGNKIAVKLANDSGDPSSAGTLGLVAETIASGANGWVITEGPLRKLNTIGLTAGKLLFLGSTPGTYTETPPTAPSHSVRLGYVERVHASVGSIYVKIDNGYEIGELHDVVDNTTTGSYGDLFVKSGSIWVSSKQLTGSYGLTGSLQATSFTGSLQGTSSWASNAVTASFALTASYLNPVTNDYIVLTQVSQSLNYVDDAAAASGGVPLGGLYRNGNFILIRIS